MSNHAECDECRAIAEELNAAYAEVWASMAPEVREEMLAARKAALGMMGGTEENAERAEEMLHKFKFRLLESEPAEPTLFGADQESGDPRIRRAVLRMFKHLGQQGAHMSLLSKLIRRPE